jgi:dihydrofolate synthase/folylpolyglutamate synthase
VYLGRPVEAEVDVRLPGRLEIRGDEVRDGAHTPAAAAWLLERLPEPHEYVVVASILDDKDAAGILAGLAPAGDTLVATRSSNDRALSASAVAEQGKDLFSTAVAIDDPHEALAHARALGRPVLVTGSLYLLADLAERD